MIVTIEMQIDDDDAQHVVAALDRISDSVSEAGYEDGGFETVYDRDSHRVNYRIIRGYAGR